MSDPDPVCYLCQDYVKNVGHVTTHCPRAVCKLCGQKGHVKKVCPQKLNSKRQQSQPAVSVAPPAKAIKVDEPEVIHLEAEGDVKPEIGSSQNAINVESEDDDEAGNESSKAPSEANLLKFHARLVSDKCVGQCHQVPRACEKCFVYKVEACQPNGFVPDVGVGQYAGVAFKLQLPKDAKIKPTEVRILNAKENSNFKVMESMAPVLCHVHLWRFTLVSRYLPQFQRKYAKNVNKFAT